MQDRIAYWTQFASNSGHYDRIREGYRSRLAEIYRLLIPPKMRVLEIGSGEGDLLAAVEPACGIGVDFCVAMIERARAKYPGIRFVEADAHSFDLREEFDYIVLSDLVNDVWHVQDVFNRVARHAHSGTR